MTKISDERLAELYEIFADRATEETCGVKEDIDVAAALSELAERRALEKRESGDVGS